MNRRPTVRLVDQDGFESILELAALDGATGISGLGGLLGACRQSRVETETCPVCGTTLQQSLQSGLMGCGLCYTVLYPAWNRKRSPNSDS